jgi:type I restriction enzyme, S subunit
MTQKLTLGDLFRVGSSKRVLKSQWRSEGVPFYRGREVTRLALDGFVENELFIPESLYAELSSQYGVPKADDIMITAIGTIGNSYVVRKDDRFYFKDASVLWLKKTGELSSEFVNYWLKSDQFFGQLDRGNGATVDTLTIQKLQSLVLELPQLAAQRRIVAILDEAFDGIATAKANAEKNLQIARELFGAILARAFPGGAAAIELADLALSISDGDHSPPPKAVSGVPFITISNVNKETREIDFSDTFTVPRAYFDRLKPERRPRAGDVLYTVTGSFGVPVLVNEGEEFCFQRHIGLIRPKLEVDSRWLMYGLLSPMAFAQAEAGATGTAQRTVSLGVLRRLKLPRVCLNAQRRNADRLDALCVEVDRLKDTTKRKLAALDELKKSLLHQAFSGALMVKSAERQLEAVA